MMALAPNGDLFVSSTQPARCWCCPTATATAWPTARDVFADGLDKPHGLAFHEGYLYVATEAAVFRFPYADGQLRGAGAGPEDRRPALRHRARAWSSDVNHDTRSIAFGPDNKMYISAGSDCDLCEEDDPRRAAIMQFNDDGSGGRVFAQGLAQRGRASTWTRAPACSGPRSTSATGAATTSRPTA